MLGIDEDTQRVIADELIPDNTRGKIRPDGEVSRIPIFTVRKIWDAANKHLQSLERVRRESHRRMDGTKSGQASRAQLKLIYDVARQLGWDEKGEDSLKDRLIGFTDRFTRKRSKPVTDLSNLSSREARNMIQALITMRKQNAA